MQPYTAHENEWLAGKRPAPAASPVNERTPVIDDATIRYHMRRGERIRAQEVKRCFSALFRLPGNAIRALSASLGALGRRGTVRDPR